MAETRKIFIAGAGGIGRAVGLLMREIADFEVELWLGDIFEDALADAKAFIGGESEQKGEIHTVLMPRENSNDALANALSAAEVLLDCLPGSQAPRMARLAKQHGCHYANLTEYVQETNEIMDLAQDAETGFILQTGLAPGFIGVLGMQLFQKFCRDHGVSKVDYVALKVGALTRNALAPHYYGFTWSPIGVATEYVKPAVVIRNGRKTELPSLSERESLLLDGIPYEADLTSGGAADLPDALAGKTRKLDYKTLRYPGHYAWVDGLVEKVPAETDLPGMLQDIMLNAVPSVEDDRVLIHAYVEGKDAHGRKRLVEAGYRIEPLQIGGRTLRAIQTTTAAPLAECARMLLDGHYKGLVLQSELDAEAFMAGPFVNHIYGKPGK